MCHTGPGEGGALQTGFRAACTHLDVLGVWLPAVGAGVGGSRGRGTNINRSLLLVLIRAHVLIREDPCTRRDRCCCGCCCCLRC